MTRRLLWFPEIQAPTLAWFKSQHGRAGSGLLVKLRDTRVLQ